VKILQLGVHRSPRGDLLGGVFNSGNLVRESEALSDASQLITPRAVGFVVESGVVSFEICASV
jgi:hypothetical protein